jgi:hypothetical protein
METRRTSWGHSLLGLVIVLCIALGMAGCGDSDEGGDANANNDQAAKSGSSAPSGEREEVGDVMVKLRDRFNKGDGDGFCSLLTANGQREIAAFSKSVPEIKARGCAPFMSKYSGAIAVKSDAKQTPVKLRTVDIKGPKAKLVMGGGLAGIRAIATFNLVKRGGDWKLDDPVSGSETRTLPKKYRKY